MSKYLKDWKAKEFLAKVSGNLVNNLDAVGQFVTQQARARAPERTGELKEAITYEITATGEMVEVVVGVEKDAFWGYFQEVGTSRMAARPFLRPAVFNNGDEILRMVGGR